VPVKLKERLDPGVLVRRTELLSRQLGPLADLQASGGSYFNLASSFVTLVRIPDGVGNVVLEVVVVVDLDVGTGACGATGAASPRSQTTPLIGANEVHRDPGGQQKSG
jgi:hypothetical protein